MHYWCSYCQRKFQAGSKVRSINSFGYISAMEVPILAVNRSFGSCQENCPTFINRIFFVSKHLWETLPFDHASWWISSATVTHFGTNRDCEDKTTCWPSAEQQSSEQQTTVSRNHRARSNWGALQCGVHKAWTSYDVSASEWDWTKDFDYFNQNDVQL